MLTLLGIVVGFPLIAWTIWGLVVSARDSSETFSDGMERYRIRKAEDAAGLPPPRKTLFWRINDKMPDTYKF